MNEGLTYHEILQFQDFLVKANKEQLRGMQTSIFTELKKRVML